MFFFPTLGQYLYKMRGVSMVLMHQSFVTTALPHLRGISGTMAFHGSHSLAKSPELLESYIALLFLTVNSMGVNLSSLLSITGEEKAHGPNRYSNQGPLAYRASTLTTELPSHTVDLCQFPPAQLDLSLNLLGTMPEQIGTPMLWRLGISRLN